MEEHIVRWLRDNDALVCIAGGVVLVACGVLGLVLVLAR